MDVTWFLFIKIWWNKSSGLKLNCIFFCLIIYFFYLNIIYFVKNQHINCFFAIFVASKIVLINWIVAFYFVLLFLNSIFLLKHSAFYKVLKISLIYTNCWISAYVSIYFVYEKINKIDRIGILLKFFSLLQFIFLILSQMDYFWSIKQFQLLSVYITYHESFCI